MSNSHIHWLRSRRTKCAVGIAGLLGALAFAAPPAGAATASGSLYVYKFAPGEHCFRVEGRIPMNQYDAQGYINNGAVIGVTMWGDDPSYDDVLIGPRWGNGIAQGDKPAIHASAQGLEVRWWACTPSSVLNEDWGGDELYVSADVFGGGGSGRIGGFQTNRVNGSY